MLLAGLAGAAVFRIERLGSCARGRHRRLRPSSPCGMARYGTRGFGHTCRAASRSRVRIIITLGVLIGRPRGYGGRGALQCALGDSMKISGMVLRHRHRRLSMSPSSSAASAGGTGWSVQLMSGLPGGRGVRCLLIMPAGLHPRLHPGKAIEIIYIVVPLLGPAILGTDISPVWFAVLPRHEPADGAFLDTAFRFCAVYFPLGRTAIDHDHRYLSRSDTFRLAATRRLGILLAVP